MRRVRELLDVHDAFAQDDDGCLVFVHVAVVRGREDGHDWRNDAWTALHAKSRPLLQLETFRLRFVRTDDREQLVVFEKPGHCSLAVEVGALAHFVLREVVFRVWVLEVYGVGPEQVAAVTRSYQKRPLRGGSLNRSIRLMVSIWSATAHRFQIGRNATVHCEVPVVDDAGERHEVEAVHHDVVGFLIELGQTLHAEVHVRSHAAALVVPSQQVHVLGEVELQRVEQQYDFDGEVASVNEVAQEEVPG